MKIKLIIALMLLTATASAEPIYKNRLYRLSMKPAMLVFSHAVAQAGALIFDERDYVTTDGYYHLGAGYIAAMAGEQIERSVFGTEYVPKLVWSMLAGLAKETIDASQGGEFSGSDLMATLAGGGVALTLEY